MSKRKAELEVWQAILTEEKSCICHSHYASPLCTTEGGHK